MGRSRQYPNWLLCTGLTGILFTLGAAPATAPSESSVVPWPWQYSVESSLSSPQQSNDPIAPLAEKISDVVEDLSAQKTDEPVQTKQKEIVSSLDGIIKQLEQQSHSGSGGGNPNPTKPMARSQLVGGPGGSGPLHDPHAGTRVWGQLPPQDRDQIIQSQTEGFPAGYESVLANYYTRLSQSQSGADSTAPEIGPTTQPANP
jgi:hypothetical protein